MDEDVKPRLEVDDKRKLFCSLMAMTERLLMLNKFPEDQLDFALSLWPRADEAAWRWIDKHQSQTIVKSSNFEFYHLDAKFFLHTYFGEDTKYAHQQNIFPTLKGDVLPLTSDNRFYKSVDRWVKNQLQLEDQVLRTIKVIQDIVETCNTIGQYKRVSPELVAFIPERYQLALRDYDKRSPYPTNLVSTKEEIDAAIANLAFASLQPQHKAEEDYLHAIARWRGRYNIKNFPRTVNYAKKAVRRTPV